jgi:hypothetical protein
MRNKLKSSLLGLLSATTALSALPPEAMAGPMSIAPPATVALKAPTIDVHYYRHWGRPHWGYRHWGYRHWGWRPHYRHWGYYRPYYHWGYYRPYYRRVYYPAYGYYNPGAAVFGSALGLMGLGLAAATAPAWGLGWGGGWGGWGYPGYGYAGWGGGWW